MAERALGEIGWRRRNETQRPHAMSQSIEDIARRYWEIAGALPGSASRLMPSRMPTPEDIAGVEAALSTVLPASVHYFVLNAPFGSQAFTSDFSCFPSIVWVNKEFHKNDEGYLPPFLLMWDAGHDGDCTCFDTRFPSAVGEYPLTYWDYDSMTEADIPAIQILAPTFPKWLLVQTEHLLRHVR